jgi:hypothetical protein
MLHLVSSAFLLPGSIMKKLSEIIPMAKFPHRAVAIRFAILPATIVVLTSIRLKIFLHLALYSNRNSRGQMAGVDQTVLLRSF